MTPYIPSRILVDPAVRDSPLTRRVLSHFPSVAVESMDDSATFKKPQPHSEAKKNLVITQHKGNPLKNCQGMGDYVCCSYFTVAFSSNCHYECTYCILQDYLKNNPAVTLFANVDEILASIEAKLSEQPDTLFRVGTGEIADSLALDDITHLSGELVPFAAAQKNLLLELKTKSAQIGNLLDLDHRGKTVVSWSLNPQAFIDAEEHKTASLEERLMAARAVADCGYPVGFHFDPLLALPGWREEYAGLIERVASEFEEDEIAWISLGSLRFTPGLKKIVAERFPKSPLLYGELFPTTDGKVRYFREVREELYRHVRSRVEEAYPRVPNYLCMETSKVWENVYREVPADRMTLEDRLVERFREFSV